MKLAVTYENGAIFQHFGHTAAFKIYEITEGKVVDAQVVSTSGSGHGALATFLRALNVQALICGGIGGGARMALADAGVVVYGGVSGDADAAVEAFLSGGLNYDPQARCSHHDHEEGHSCGDHHDHHCGGNCSH